MAYPMSDDLDDLTMFGSGDVPVALTSAQRKLSIQERFEAFHEANPWVYRTLRSLALDLNHKGHHKIGINMLWEVLRWQYKRSTADPNSSFKLNDHYPSRYARLLTDREPELAEAFELRALRAP
jgi:hypothetical protein